MLNSFFQINLFIYINYYRPLKIHPSTFKYLLTRKKTSPPLSLPMSRHVTVTQAHA